jgi:hypothetical protein
MTLTAPAQSDHDRMVAADVAHLSWAAKRLNIGLSTAYRLAPLGQIPGAFRVGVQWRVSVPRFNAVVHGQAS